jgi:hypothetical protein
MGAQAGRLTPAQATQAKESHPRPADTATITDLRLSHRHGPTHPEGELTPKPAAKQAEPSATATNSPATVPGLLTPTRGN